MKLTSSSRFVAAFLTLISLLFMQLAVAAYVCPVMPIGADHNAIVTAVQLPCHRMDHDQPSLCRVHASDASIKLSLDLPDVPDVHAFVPVRMAQTIEVLPLLAPSTAQPSRLFATLLHPPPVAILHCCFRI